VGFFYLTVYRIRLILNEPEIGFVVVVVPNINKLLENVITRCKKAKLE
jgi:hypothetical protein